jgi:hypothetical protein
MPVGAGATPWGVIPRNGHLPATSMGPIRRFFIPTAFFHPKFRKEIGSPVFGPFPLHCVRPSFAKMIGSSVLGGLLASSAPSVSRGEIRATSRPRQHPYPNLKNSGCHSRSAVSSVGLPRIAQSMRIGKNLALPPLRSIKPIFIKLLRKLGRPYRVASLGGPFLSKRNRILQFVPVRTPPNAHAVE